MQTAQNDTSHLQAILNIITSELLIVDYRPPINARIQMNKSTW